MDNNNCGHPIVSIYVFLQMQSPRKQTLRSQSVDFRKIPGNSAIYTNLISPLRNEIHYNVAEITRTYWLSNICFIQYNFTSV